ncbi:MAG: hypothetical protein V2J55_09295 [Candidatus Competibacteraceae bacterium]|jgi:hypothetical protein|nr:hypothetical protein [Candidatus Competibacteraceae bacterium]
MKLFSVRLLGFLLTLLISGVAFGQFQDKTEYFAEPGAGDKMREYMFVVPEGCTITTPEGATINAGETLAIPGSLITLMGREEAEKAEAANMPFNDKGTYTAEELSSHVMISLAVPEGFTISHTDGRTVEGPNDLMLIVQADAVKHSEPLTNQPSLFRGLGTM